MKIILILSFIRFAFTQPRCCLCDGCSQDLLLPNKITQYGSCGDIFLSLYDKHGIFRCNESIALFRSDCCSPDYISNGTNGICNVCVDGSYPRKPFTVTAVLGIEGNPTCRDLYYLGLLGRIEDRLCKPLQDYYMDPCGC